MQASDLGVSWDFIISSFSRVQGLNIHTVRLYLIRGKKFKIFRG